MYFLLLPEDWGRFGPRNALFQFFGALS